MKSVQNSNSKPAHAARTSAEISRQRSRMRRQRPETVAAIEEFRRWDRQMIERFGRLYYKTLNCSVH